ncbi:hypothetical protein [Puniceibacterium sp. IMCC21224]|uniref:hypothetical protein n=1 Tax=Puniceibacterium sp. IMCC21224 TaxID=1618204 RepID=UPI00065D017B|nr:hypothetical protein [Puniceibacterium sp. IMCC21224]KMK67863.1 hypothetical protein IMCC21224_112740 [Puniceibacterium sp. IMCC21224]
MSPDVVIEIRDQTTEEIERRRYLAQGQFLARQENWAELGRLIRTFDTRRLTTPGGTPMAELLAEGARADAVGAACDAIILGDAKAAEAPLRQLDDMLSELCEDHGVALVVARAYMEVGLFWRGEEPGDTMPVAQQAAFQIHFRTAYNILERFDPFELDAPSLAAARCALLVAETQPALRVADDYEDLIDLDPQSPRHMRAMGLHLLPLLYGNHEALELEARRTVARTLDIWGAGAYVWVHLDALSRDPDAFRRLDAEFFAEGLHDIVERRPDQHTVNVLAAFTGYTLAGTPAPNPDAARPQDQARARVARCFDWIARDHLTEVHPLVWAQAADPDGVHRPCDGPLCGRDRALTALARVPDQSNDALHVLDYQPARITLSS